MPEKNPDHETDYRILVERLDHFRHSVDSVAAQVATLNDKIAENLILKTRVDELERRVNELEKNEKELYEKINGMFRAHERFNLSYEWVKTATKVILLGVLTAGLSYFGFKSKGD